eukprot:Nk52_evm18s310 gene=Nk52_evmTU18s310
MSSIGTGYDLSATTFSPDGRVFQVEYASKAVENSGTAVGIRVKDGVVFGVEKLIPSKLLEPGTNRRLFTVDRQVGVAAAGLIADSRQIVNRARAESKDYRSFYGIPMPCRMMCERVSYFVQVYTLYGHVRPFGCSVMLGSYEHDEPQLYMIEPSGTSWGYYGCSIGKGKQAARTEIEKLKLDEMDMKTAVKEVARIIYTVHDSIKDKEFLLEMSWVGKNTNGIHKPVPEDIIAEAEAYAKQATEDLDD